MRNKAEISGELIRIIKIFAHNIINNMLFTYISWNY